MSIVTYRFTIAHPYCLNSFVRVGAEYLLWYMKFSIVPGITGWITRETRVSCRPST